MLGVESFGEVLKQLRREDGMRQLDLVDALNGVIARSTLANVEVGRENPSIRLWEAICSNLPHWVSRLEPLYRAKGVAVTPTPFEVSGPFELLEATYVYTFREHRAPEEIVQLRRVRALTDGADGYGLKLMNNSVGFDLDSEALFGGWIEQHERILGPNEHLHLTRFHFDRQLSRGEVHQFATRSWVADDDPGQVVTVRFTRPTMMTQLRLNFLSPNRVPQQVYRFGPLPDPNAEPESAEGQDPLPAVAPGIYSLRIDSPVLGHLYGVGWEW